MTDTNQNLTYYQKNKIAIQKRSKKHYENNKEKRKEDARNRFQNMRNEERHKLNENRRAWYSKLDKDRKNKIRKAARNIYYAISVS